MPAMLRGPPPRLSVDGAAEISMGPMNGNQDSHRHDDQEIKSEQTKNQRRRTCKSEADIEGFLPVDGQKNGKADRSEKGDDRQIEGRRLMQQAAETVVLTPRARTMEGVRIVILQPDIGQAQEGRR